MRLLERRSGFPLLFVVGLAPATVRASESPPSYANSTASASSDRGARSGAGIEQAARAHFSRGAALFQGRDYAGAWLEFTSAYQLTPKPGLLYNMAKCELKLSRPRDALNHLRAYQRAVPNDPDGAVIRQEIEELEAEVARQDQRQAIAQRQTELPDGKAAQRPFPVYGTVAAGATLTFAIIGAAVLGSTGSKYDNLQNSCAPRCLPEQVNPLRHQSVAGYTLLGIAGAGAIVTAVLFTLELRRGRPQFHATDHRRTARFATIEPVVGPLQLGLAGSF